MFFLIDKKNTNFILLLKLLMIVESQIFLNKANKNESFESVFL